MCSTTPRSRFSIARLCGIPLIAATFSATAAGQCYYTWEEIPNPPGWVCYGAAINNRGHVAGNLLNLGENTRGFTWTPETGTRVLPFPNGAYDMTVTDMNDAGQVTGWATSTAQGWFGFVWDGSGYTIIPRPDWATQIRPRAINNAGQVVGTIMNTGTGPSHAFIWENGALLDIASIIGTINSEAAVLSELGLVGGSGRNTETLNFILDDSRIEWLPQPPTTETTRTTGVNDTGFVVGSMTEHNPTFRRLGLIWTPWDYYEIAYPPAGVRVATFAGINNAGRAVGSYQEGLYTPIAWDSGTVVDLRPLIRPTAPPGLVWSMDINGRGQIIVQANGGTVILNPIWLPGDLTGDCHVGFDDLMLVLGNFGSPVGTFPRGDVDLDGDVDISDLAVLLSHWGE